MRDGDGGRRRRRGTKGNVGPARAKEGNGDAIVRTHTRDTPSTWIWLRVYSRVAQFGAAYAGAGARARDRTAAESARNACVARRFPIYESLAGLRSVSCTAIDCAPKGGESRVGGSARVGGAGGGADRG